MIGATLTDNTSSPVAPGETIHYTETISNTAGPGAGNDALNVQVSQMLDSNTTLVPGSLNISPLAFDDSFTAVGNTQLIVNGTGTNPGSSPAAVTVGNLFTNDKEFANDLGTLDTFTLKTFTQPTSGGASSVMVNSDGTFTYTPKAGFTGTDTFTYTITDDGTDGIAGNADDLTGTGTVTITVSNLVWYVDNAAVTNGNGTSTSPFNTLASVSGATGPDAAGDIIFVSTGSSIYTGGITLLNNQTLWGQGSALVVNGFTLQAAGTDPTIANAGGNGVTLASGNTLKGFTVGDTSGYDVANTTTATVGALTITNVDLTGTGGLFRADSGGTLNVTFDTATSTSTGSGIHGIQLAGSLTGSFTATTGAISGGSSTGTDILINGGTETVSIGSSITSSTGGSIDIGSHATGSITLSGALNITGGTGINVHNNTSGTITFSNASNVVNTGANTAVNLATNAGATINFPLGGLDIDTTTGAGFLAAGGGTISVAPGGNSITTTTGQVLNWDGVNVGASGVVFSSLTASGTVAGATAVLINNVDGIGTFSANTVSVAGTSGASSDGVAVTGGSAASFSFGTVTISNTGRDGINLNGANGLVTVLNVTINNTAGQGVEITNAVSTVHITSGNIGNTNDPDGNGLLISGGNAFDISIGAAINKTTANNVVSITGRTGGTVTLSGNITASSAGGGIAVTSNTGATIAFTGGMSINTTTSGGDAFTATGGGTVTATQNNTSIVNTLTAGAGTALNVSNTTIGAAGLTFRSISSGSATSSTANGIILSNTSSSGSLTVTGNGTTGSGGTIQHKTGADGSTTQGSGIFLSSTSGVSLDRMQLNDFEGFAIRGISVTGFSLSNTTINGVNGNNAAVGTDESSIRFDNLFTSASFPTAAITNCDIGGGKRDNIGVVNTSGTLNRLTISNTTIRFVDNNTGNDALHFEGFNSGTVMNLTVTGSTFKGARGDMIETNAQLNVTQDVVIRSNSFTNEQTNVVSANTAIIVQGAGGVTYDISCNKVQQVNAAGTVGTAQGHGINVAKSTAGGNFSGTIFNNTIGKPGVANSGAGTAGDGIQILSNGTGTHTTLVKNNVISNYGEAGIKVAGNNGNSTANVTIIGNTTTEPNPTFGFAGLFVDVGAFPSDSNTFNVKVGGSGAEQNDFTAGDPFNASDISLNETAASTNTHLNLTRPPSASNDPIVVLQDNNTGTPAVSNSGTITLVDTVPTLPAAINESCSPPALLFASGIVTEASATCSAGATIVSDNTTQPPAPEAPLAQIVEPSILEAPATVSEESAADAVTTVAQPTISQPTVIVDDGALSQSNLDSLVAAVIARWEATGLTAEQDALLKSVVFTTEDLPGLMLGEALPGHVVLDSNAAGNKWFVDPTPEDDSEYAMVGTAGQASSGTQARNATEGVPYSAAAGRVDALTTVMHELGHQLGLDDTYAAADSSNLMYGFIHLGERRLPAAGQADGAVPHLNGGPDFAFSPIVIGTLPAGKSVTIKFDATVNSPVAAGVESVTLQGTVSGSNFANVLTDDPDVAGTANPTVTQINAAPDLSVTKDDGVMSAAPGDTLTYTLNYSNMGMATQNASGVKITDTLPAGTSFVAAENPGWSLNVNTLTFTIGALNVGASSSTTLKLHVTSPAAAGQDTIVNTATISDDGTSGADSDTTNNSATDTDTLNASPDLSITKSDGNNPGIQPGAGVTYALTYRNLGNQNATGVVLHETVPVGTTFDSANSTAGWMLITPGGGGAGSAGSTYDFSAGTLNVGDTPADVNFAVTSGNPFTGGAAISNTATISYAAAEDSNSANNSSTDTTPVISDDLIITKDDGLTTATPGTMITYTVVVSNASTSTQAATGATVNDMFPGSLTDVTLTNVGMTNGATSGATPGAVSGTFGDTVNLPINSSVTYTFTAVIDAGATGSLANTATVTAPAGFTEGNTANNTATDTDTLTPQTDVSVTKDDGVTSAVPGQTTTYTIVVANAGPSSATSTSLTDMFDPIITAATWTSVASGGATGNTASGSGDISQTLTLPPNSSVTYMVTAAIAGGATGSLSNTATISQASDTTPGNNTETDTDTLTPQADLSITKTDSPDPILPSGTIQYTITVANTNGPSDVVGASVQDAFDSTAFSSVSWTSSVSGGATATASGSGDINDTVNLPKGSSIVYTVMAVLSGSFSGNSVDNTATVSSAIDTDTTNNSATATTSVIRDDLSITKSDGQTTAVPGTPITYTVVVSNGANSSMAANGATVSDTFPSSLSNLNLTNIATTNGAMSSATTGPVSGPFSDSVDLPVNSSVTYTFTAVIAANATGSLTNTATVTAPAGFTEPDTSNNSAADTDTLTPEADLAISKSGPTTAVVGDAAGFDYTLTVTNNGPSDNTGGFIVTDVLPAGTTIQSSTDFGDGNSVPSFTGNFITFTNTSGLISGGQHVYILHMTVDSSVADGTVLHNSATVTVNPNGTTDPDSTNNTSNTVDTTVQARADLLISKSGPSTAVAGAGAGFNYMLTVTNNGPSDNAGGFTVTDVLPAGTVFQAAGSTPGASVNGQTITYTNIAGLIAGGMQTFTIHVTVPSSVANNTVLHDSATVATNGTTDSTSSNNTSNTVDTTVSRNVDLAVSKSGTLSVVAGSGSGNVVYVVTVHNNGPSDASGVTLSEVTTLEPGVTVDSVVGSAGTSFSGTNGTGTWTVGNLAAGADATLTVTMTASASAAAGANVIGDTATETAVTEGDTNPGNNSASKTTTVTRHVDLAVSKIGPASVVAGSGTGNLVYVVTVHNNGPSDASGVALSEVTTLEPGVTVDSVVGSSGTSFSGASGTGTWTVGNLAAGAEATLTLTLTVGASAAAGNNVISNTASESAVAEGDTNGGNNSATKSTSVTTQADLAVNKTGAASVATDSNLIYTITLTNNGPSDAQTVSLSDPLPAGTTFVSETHPAGFTAIDPPVNTNGTVTFTALSLASGALATFTITVHTDPNLVQGTLLSNTATASASTTDTTSSNNASTLVTTVNSLDFGDAPDSYHTLLANNGPRHRLGSGLFLGASIDAEADGQPTAGGSGDDTHGIDDEDGVTLPATIVAGLGATINVVASAPGKLDAWLDFNRNGVFDAGEQIAVSLPVVAGNNALSFTVPVTAVGGASYARFRLSSAGGLSPTGLAANGEVEDYAVQIAAPAKGSASLQPDTQNPGQTVLLVVGTSQNDALIIEPRPSNMTEIRVKQTGKLIGIFPSSAFQRIVVYGLEGNDTIIIDSRIAKPAELHGNAGNDMLIGGSRNDLLFGEEGNDYLIGVGGNDILVGGSGNDRLYGGTGRDVLIGGPGIDRLYGQDGDDILIGGTTDHDTNIAALNSIMAEWSSSHSFSARIADLGPLLNSSTVHDDGQRDTLDGGGGRDWYLDFLLADTINGFSSNPTKGDKKN